MRRIFCCFAILFFFTSCKAGNKDTVNFDSDSIRYPAFAGQFYAADSSTLTLQIKSFFANAKPARIENPVAIIVPHAGYIYSGQIAADAYNQVKNNNYEVVVVLGTNHTTAGFSKFGIYPNGAFSTPIGTAKIDNQISDGLIKNDPDVKVNLTVHAKEHSIEVQIPFIKYLFPNAKIIPIIVGEPDINMCSKFGEVLAKVMKDKKVLIVASSDLSHYPAFNDALKVDNKTLKTIAGMNLNDITTVMQNQLEQKIPELVTCACGEAPIVAAIAAAKAMGANSGSVISYSNSGYNSIGSTDRCVGYGAVVFSKASPAAIPEVDTLMINNSYKLTLPDKKTLLKYARKTLEQYFYSQTLPLPRDINPLLKIKRGAFVTLNKHGELRGCVGHMTEDTPLCTVVGSMALQAAFNDKRFSPLLKEELPQIEFEISVLTPFLSIGSADDIVLGRDGVFVKKGDRQAVFLPQVATETGWSKEMFLDELCLKAGLKPGDWKSAQLFTFQADVFSESEFH